MVINSYQTLLISVVYNGTILNDTEHQIDVIFRVTREITQEEYLTTLMDTVYAWTIPTFKPHPDLKFYEVEPLPD